MYKLSHLIKDKTLNYPLLEMISKSLYYGTGLSVFIMDQNHQKVYALGNNVHVEELFEDVFVPYPDFVKEQLKLQKNGIHIYETRYELSYLTTVIADHGKYFGSILVGPFTDREPDEHLINEVLGTHKFSMAQREHIKTAYGALPILSASRNFFVQQLLLSTLTNDHILSLFPEENFSEINDDTMPYIDQNIELEKSDHNYALEVLFLTKVKNGDLEKVIDLFNEHIKAWYLNQKTADHLRTSKNKALSFSTLMARTIIEGGVETEKALSLEDFYAKQIESTVSLEDLVAVVERMTIKYTNSILQLSNINHVSVIKNASKYVHMHLSEPIRLNDVANFVNLSPNYFSSLFKREMSISFADYVNQTRIKESQYLLETTDYSILDIAISVGYNNQNYFTTIFRKFTGITPKQYRMRSAK